MGIACSAKTSPTGKASLLGEVIIDDCIEVGQNANGRIGICHLSSVMVEQFICVVKLSVLVHFPKIQILCIFNFVDFFGIGVVLQSGRCAH